MWNAQKETTLRVWSQLLHHSHANPLLPNCQPLPILGVRIPTAYHNSEYDGFPNLPWDWNPDRYPRPLPQYLADTGPAEDVQRAKWQNNTKIEIWSRAFSKTCAAESTLNRSRPVASCPKPPSTVCSGGGRSSRHSEVSTSVGCCCALQTNYVEVYTHRKSQPNVQRRNFRLEDIHNVIVVARQLLCVHLHGLLRSSHRDPDAPIISTILLVAR